MASRYLVLDMNPNLKVIETRTENIWMEDGIMRAVNKPTERHLIEDAIENVKAANALAEGDYPLLIDIRQAKHISIEARQYYASRENSRVIACALIVESPVSLIIGRMFMGINKTPFPSKVFRTDEKALEWLEKAL